MQIKLFAGYWTELFQATGFTAGSPLLISRGTNYNKARIKAKVSPTQPVQVTDTTTVKVGGNIVRANVGKVWLLSDTDLVLDVVVATQASLNNPDNKALVDDADTLAGSTAPESRDNLKKKTIGYFKLGQSNEQGSVYTALYYTTASIVGDGTKVTVTTSIANNLAEGEVYYGTITGAVPSSLNLTAVKFTATGAFPNRVLVATSSVVGTATTQGTLTLDVKASYPQAFASLTQPACAAPVWPSLSNNGSWDFRFKDRVKNELDIDLRVVNAAFGSMSLVKDLAGMVEYWNANSRYAQYRPATGNGDYGDVGSLIVINNVLWNCTTGDKRYAHYRGGPRLEGVNQKQLSYVARVQGGTTGATAPAWPAAGTATLGQTITDGAVVWTCVCPDVTTTTDPSMKNLGGGYVFVESTYGFDPLGIIAHALSAFGSVSHDLYDRVVVIQNGQSDTAMTSTWYSQAMKSVGNFFWGRGYKVALGMTCFNPKATAASYDSVLMAGRNLALTDPTFGSRYMAGPDLYTGLGNVHGAGGLYTESDNNHPTENVHLGAYSAFKAADVYFDWFKGLVDTGKI